MQLFSDLFEKLEQSVHSDQRVYNLIAYLNSADEEELIWAIALLLGKKPMKILSKSQLEEWALEEIDDKIWMYNISLDIVGDLADTLALLLPDRIDENAISLSELLKQIIHLKTMKEEGQKERIKQIWTQLSRSEKYIFNKLLIGGFKANINFKEVVDALAIFSSFQRHQIIYNLNKKWDPSEQNIIELLSRNAEKFPYYQPFPFKITNKKDDSTIELGNLQNWHIEQYWDGIRCQLIKTNSNFILWSYQDEWLSEKVPEVQFASESLPNGLVLEGILISLKNGKPLRINELHKRLNRKSISQKDKETIPLLFLAYDLLKFEGKDIRNKSFFIRRKLLKKIFLTVDEAHLMLAPNYFCKNENELNELERIARNDKSLGLILKRSDQPYASISKLDDWIILPAQKYFVNAVLLYVTYGTSNGQVGFDLECTFAVWKGKELVTFVKTNNGLDIEEQRKINDFVKQNTLERFGPVRTIKPERIFQISFQEIFESKRHKAGLILKSPLIEAELTNIKLKDIDTLQYLHQLLEN